MEQWLYARRARQGRLEGSVRRPMAAARRPDHCRWDGRRLRRTDRLPSGSTRCPHCRSELAVTVQADDESGAAGPDLRAAMPTGRHFAFYPSGGKLPADAIRRPDVYSWQVLKESPCVLRRARGTRSGPGRKGPRALHVNGQLVVELADPDFYGNAWVWPNSPDDCRVQSSFRLARPLAPSSRGGRKLRADARRRRWPSCPTQLPVTKEFGDCSSTGGGRGGLLRERAPIWDEQAANLRRACGGAAHHERCLAELPAC